LKAVVMAGGQGTRLRPLTSNQPKPMVPIVNKPCVQHILELLQRHDIDQVVMTLAFLPQHIRSYFGDGGAFGTHIEYSVEEVPAGTAGSVRLARELLQDTFLVISGDALTDFDLSALVDFHKQREAMVTIALKSVPNPLEFGVVIVDEEGRIQRFLEKPGWGQVFSDTVNTGIYVLEPEILDRIPAGEPYDFSRDLFPKLFDDHERLYGRVCDGYWQDVGSLEQYLQANRDALDGEVQLTPPGGRLRGNIWVAQTAEVEALDEIKGPVVIGEDVRIDPGAQVLPHTVLGDHTVLRRGCQVVGSVLGENVYVASGAVVTGAILGNGVEVRENAHVAQGAVVGDRSSVGRGAVIANNVKVYPFKTIEAGSEVRSSLVWETRGPSTLFGRNGVRGLANVDLTPEIAMRLAMSYGTTLGNGAVVTASRDMHEASRIVQRAMLSGLNSTGINVRDLSAATPAVNRSDLKAGNAAGSIHVQMSADAPEHMEILFSEPPGVPLDSRGERTIENHYFREDFRRASIDEMGEVVYPPGVWDVYAALLLDHWDTAAIRKRQPRLVLDFASPSTAPFFPTIVEKLGVEVITVTTARSDPRRFLLENGVPASAARVGEIVLATEGDIGAILDPAAEHLFLVDDKGSLVAHSSLLLLLLEAVAKGGAGGTVALPLNATRWAERMVGSEGVNIHRTKCSTNALLSDSVRPNTLFASDAEGGYAYPTVLPAMDGLLTLGKVLELLARQDTPLSQMVAKAPRAHVAHLVQPCPWNLKGSVMRRLTTQLSDQRVSLIDGIKVFLDKDDWALVLPDSEEALFHVYAEAADETQAGTLADEYRGRLTQAISEAGGP
jgi:mannose-1-phosphate guanylyltransferase / phosphomannomutase